MSHRVLITGASGYLGGTLLARLAHYDLPAYDKLYALVRSESQAEAVKKYGAEPLSFNVKDEKAVREAVVDNEITIVFFLIDASSAVSQGFFIKALAEVGKRLRREAHFLHTSGAKIFSSHTGAPTDAPLFDDQVDLFDIQKAQRAPVTAAQPAIDANNEVIEQAQKLGVHAYIFVPCIVYGEGEGFGNRISIQTLAIVRAARALRRVHSVDEGRPTWPICHIHDNTALYASLLHAILAGLAPPSGERGYYLAASGSVSWLDLYAAMARALAVRGVVDDDVVIPATSETRARMGTALGCPEELVGLQLGGLCTFTARNGEKIGWKPKSGPEDILAAADEEVELILATLKQ